MRENIHKTASALLVSLFHNPSTSRVVVAPECGGNHRIQLSASPAKNRRTIYCWPDIVIAHGDEVHVILELEQTGIVSPGRIGGKLLAASLCDNAHSEDLGHDALRICRDATFIQVVNTRSLRPTTAKLRQYANCEAGIREKRLPLGCIARYFLIPVLADETSPFDGRKYNLLLEAVHECLS